jgi:hypothetical protein
MGRWQTRFCLHENAGGRRRNQSLRQLGAFTDASLFFFCSTVQMPVLFMPNCRAKLLLFQACQCLCRYYQQASMPDILRTMVLKNIVVHEQNTLPV